MENRVWTIIKIILLCFIAIILLGILCVLLVGGDDMNFVFGERRGNSSNLIYDEVYENVDSIIASLKSADIEIKESDSDVISLKIYGKDVDDLNTSVNDNKLSIIEDSRASFCIGFCYTNQYKIILSVPKEKKIDLDISTASGDINVGEILMSNVKITAVSGDINMINADSVILESVSGDISCHSVGNIKVKSVSGNIDIYEVSDKLDLKTTSGDVEVEYLNIVKDSSISTVSGDVDITFNNSNCYINTNTLSGDVDIDSNNRKSDIELKVSTTSGDIEVGK